METTATRVSIDCRDHPSESNCSLRVSGSESEVLAVLHRHAIDQHGHPDSPELMEMLRGAMKPSAD